MRRTGTIGAAALLSLALAAGAGCATAGGGLGRGGGSTRGARAAFDAWLLRGDVAGAEPRFREAARDPGDAWARLGLAMLARRSLDAQAEAGWLVAAVAAAPGDAVALPALERLSELAAVSPEIDRAIEAGLAPLAASGRLRGVAAVRARVARIAAAESSGDVDAVARLRQENGGATEWTLVGPFAPLAALDFDAPLAVDRGELPREAPGVAGAPPIPARTLPTPDALVALDGEPHDGALYVVAAEVTVARGGSYLLSLWTRGSARVLVDGLPVAERRDFERFVSTAQLRELALAPGAHRVVVRFAPPDDRSPLAVGLARADGDRSDAAWRALPPGPVPPLRAGASPAPEPWTAPRLAAALEPGGGRVLARLLAARAMLRLDREAAKALLAEAVALAPDAEPVHATLADALADDPTLDDQVARARGEAERRRALERDPADAEVRVELADDQRKADRAADAEAMLDPLPAAVADRPLALVARARVAKARGEPERADALAGRAAAGGSCEARAMLLESASDRDAAAEVDRLAREVAACRNGPEQLALLLRKRGDPQGALAALAADARARPSALEPALQRASLRVAAGDAPGALGELERIAALWPRSARPWKRIAEVRELTGDRAGARAARERALAIDGADLPLRRALALDDGREVLDDLAEDGAAAIRAYEAAGPAGDTSTALVLDASAVQFHLGGAITERTHQVVHVLDQRGVDRYGEVTFPPGSEVLTLRTRKPDGRTFEPDGGHGKGSTSLSGLEPGDYVEVEYLRATRGLPDGHAADAFFFQNEAERLVRSTYVVAAPEAVGVELDAHALAAPAPERAEGRLVWRVLRTDVPAIVGEPGSPRLGEILPFVQAGYGGGRETFQRRLASAVLSRTRATVELDAFAREIRTAAGAGAGPEALAREAYAQVTKRILGDGALGDEASQVLSRGRGSRTILLKAVLDRLGVDARIVQVRPFAADPAPYRFPRGALYGETVMRLRAGGRELWIDPDVRGAPFGALSSSVLDAEGLVLPAAGEAAAVVRTPPEAVVPSTQLTAARLTLEAGGAAAVEATARYGGFAGGEVRKAMEPFDASARRVIFQQLVAATFRGGSLESAEVRGEEDRTGDITFVYRVRVPSLARATGGGLAIEAPIYAAQLGASFVRLAERQLPLLQPSMDPTVLRVEIVPPPGMTIAPRAPLKLAGRFGTYDRTERLEKGVLVRDERLALRRMRIPPAEYREFAAFVKAVDDAQSEPTLVTAGDNPGGRARPEAARQNPK